MTFKFMATVSAVIAATLTIIYGASPEVAYWIFSIPEGGETSDFISRRAAVLFLGFAALLWTVRNEPPSAARRGICLSAAVLTGVLAVLGLVEFFRGFAGGRVWGVVILELALMAGFGRLWLQGN